MRKVFAALIWTVAGLAAVAVLLVLLLIALVSVDGVHSYLLALAQRRATAALGVPVTLQNFSVDVPALRVDLYGLTIESPPPHPSPPLLQVNHVEARVRLVSIFQPKWYLARLKVDHPVAWIVEGPHGKSNLPALPGGSGKPQFNLFRLAVHHLILDRGEIYYNDRPHAFDAELHKFTLGAAYSAPDDAYQGALSYQDGRIQFRSLRPVFHSLSATFILTPHNLVLNRAAITIGNSRLVIDGTLRNFSRPEVYAHYETSIDVTDIRRLIQNKWIPSGVIQTSGTIAYRKIPAKAAVDGLTIYGEAQSEVLWISALARTVPIRDLACHYSLVNGELEMESLRANSLGGSITAHGEETGLGGARHGNIQITLQGLALVDAERALMNGSGQHIALSGGLSAAAAASWGSTLNDFAARVDASMAGRLRRRASYERLTTHGGRTSRENIGTGRTSVPVRGEIHAVYTQSAGRLQLTNTYFRTPGTRLVLGGTTGRRSSLSFRLHSNDLGDLTALADVFTAPREAGAFHSLGLAGQGSFQGQISGELSAPQIRGYLAVSNLRVNGSHWKSLHATIAATPSELLLENADLEPGSQGKIEVNAKAALDHWTFSKTKPIEASLDASSVKIGNLLRLAKRQLPVKGTLNTKLHLQGTITNPVGSGKISVVDASVYEQPVKSATVDFMATAGEVSGQGNVDVAGGVIRAKGTVRPDQRTYSGEVTSSGIRIGQLVRLKSMNLKAEGDLQLNASGSGSFKNPEMNGTVQISKASIENHSLSTIDLDMNLANQVISANVSSRVADAPIKARGEIALSGDYPANVSLDTGKIPLRLLLALYSPGVSDGVAGQTQIHLTLHGPLRDRRAITGEIAIPDLTMTYNNKVSLSAATPIRADYRSGYLQLQPTVIHGTDVNLRMQGTIPVFGQAPMSLQVLGSVNLQIVQLLEPNLRSSGLARFDIHSGNGSSVDGLGGEIDIEKAGLSFQGLPVGLQDGNGVLTLNNSRIDISKFQGTIGGGAVTAQGGITLRPRIGFDLGMAATDVRILYPQGVRESVNAHLRFTGSTEQALLGGSVGISDLSFTPAFDPISMIGQFSTGVSAPTALGFTQNVALNIAVRSTNALSPSSRTMSVTGSTALLVRGTLAHPALVGRVNLTGGSMIFHGDHFVLRGGTIQFVNPNEIRPVLNLSLSTTIQQYDIDLRFNGPADRLRGEYSSNPSLPRADIISLLAFGTTTEAHTNNPTPANQAAEALIASQVSSQVTSRMSKIAGISQLSISPVLTSGTVAGPPGAVITVRQQVTGNLFITFSTNVASTQSETVQGEYRLSPRVAVSATRDPNGGFAVDALIKKSW